MQKKKGRQGVCLNLAREPNKGVIDCYSPAKVVKAKEYQEQKEALKAAEEEAKLQRKIQQAANALKNKIKRERKAKETAKKRAQAAIKREAKARVAEAKKALKEQQNSIRTKAKKATSTVLKQLKALFKVKAPIKFFARRSIIVPNLLEVVVVPEARKTATRTITRP